MLAAPNSSSGIGFRVAVDRERLQVTELVRRKIAELRAPPQELTFRAIEKLWGVSAAHVANLHNRKTLGVVGVDLEKIVAELYFSGSVDELRRAAREIDVADPDVQGEHANARDSDLNPYARVRARADFQALPRWAQTFWASQVQPLTGSRQTDRVKEARLLDELDAIIRQVASGELTEENAVTDTAGVAPTPPRREPTQVLPLAKGLDEHGRPKKRPAR